MDEALRILAVDNEPSVSLSMRYLFDGPRYALTTVNDGDAALAQLGVDPDPFDVIIVDQKMPHVSGLELVGEIRRRGIRAKIIVVSAHLSSEIRQAYEGLDVHTMFSKPYDIDMLRAAVGTRAA
jgi:DNA-binding response OmpR family regulator